MSKESKETKNKPVEGKGDSKPSLASTVRLETKTSKPEIKGNPDPSFAQFKELPKDPKETILGYFPPKELGKFASISKKFLEGDEEELSKTEGKEKKKENKELEQPKKIDFSKQRQQALRNDIAKALPPLDAKASSPAEDKFVLHRLLLQPDVLHFSHKYNRKIELVLYGEILAGQLTIAEAMEGISALSGLTGSKALAPQPLVAKLIVEKLTDWQKKGLEKGFTLADICSNWFSPFHVEVSELRIADIHPPLQMVDQLRGLTEVQTRGLKAGFSLARVKAPGFSLIYVEVAEDRTYDYPVALLSQLLPANVLQVRLRVGGAEIGRDIWRAAIFARVESGPDKGFMYLYSMLFQNSVGVLDQMRVSGGYTKAEWQALISTPAASGPQAGCAPLLAAALKNQIATLDYLRVSGEYTQPEWGAALLSPAPSGTLQGYTPLHYAASAGNVEVVDYLRVSGGYTKAEWGAAILTPLEKEGQADNKSTPLYIAVAKRHLAVLKQMQLSGEYEPKEWRTVISNPLAGGINEGYTPLFAAAASNNVEMLEFIQKSGKYEPAEWRAAICKPLESGSKKGVTPLYEGALKGHIAVLDQMRLSGKYKPAEWRAAICMPLESGPNEGRTPLFAAAIIGHVAMLDSMRINGGYNTPKAWRAIINMPLIGGPYADITPLEAAVNNKITPVLESMRKEAGYSDTEWQAVMGFPVVTPIVTGAGSLGREQQVVEGKRSSNVSVSASGAGFFASEPKEPQIESPAEGKGDSKSSGTQNREQPKQASEPREPKKESPAERTRGS